MQVVILETCISCFISTNSVDYIVVLRFLYLRKHPREVKFGNTANHEDTFHNEFLLRPFIIH